MCVCVCACVCACVRVCVCVCERTCNTTIKIALFQPSLFVVVGTFLKRIKQIGYRVSVKLKYKFLGNTFEIAFFNRISSVKYWRCCRK